MMGRRRKGMSPHCVVEGAHGLHFAPCATWGAGDGSMLLSDLCTGTPKAYVTGQDGKRREVVDVEYVPSIRLFRFRYPDWGPDGPHDYASPDKMTVSVRI